MSLIKRITDKLRRKPLLVNPVVMPPLFFEYIPNGDCDIYGYITSKQDASKRKYVDKKAIKEMLQNYAHADFYWHYNWHNTVISTVNLLKIKITI